MRLIDPQGFMPDPNIVPFVTDQRQDLLAPDAPLISGTPATAGVAPGSNCKFVVFDMTVPQGQVQIIKVIAPYAMKRTNVGVAGVESFQILTPEEANGCFTFEPMVDDVSPYIITQNFNAPRLAAGTLVNNDRQRTSGITYISRDPYTDVSRAWYNPLHSILVPSGRRFRVIFSLLPPAIASPMLNVFTYGTPAVPGNKRVDFAGVIVAGQTIPEQMFRLMQAGINP